jgi:tetratricopeptide (TPR) repeat protein
VLYKYWGRFDEGLRLYGQALAALVAIHGDDSLAAGTIHHNVGGILHASGNFAAAEPPARQAWEISRRHAGEDDPRTMADAAQDAAILDGLGRHEESEPIDRRALSIFEAVLGPDHEEFGATCHNLAAVLAARGEFQEAERHYRRALAIRERILGCAAPDIALTCNNLGKLLTDVGRPSLERISVRPRPGWQPLSWARKRSDGCRA